MHGDRPPTKQRTYAVFAAGEWWGTMGTVLCRLLRDTFLAQVLGLDLQGFS